MSERGTGWGEASREVDHAVRSAAFAFLAEQVSLHEDVLPRDLLAAGFTFRGQRVPLVGPQGIFKPRLLRIPLSITTAPLVEGRARPYADELGRDNLIVYRYRGTSPDHPDNVGLRRAMQQQLPLVYFYGVVRGLYLAAWPVFVVGDAPAALSFTVAVDSPESLSERLADGASLAGEALAGRRQYVTQLTQRRLHQETFRWRVLRAYRECAWPAGG
jgi:putative restriction endonuclease